MKLVYRFSNLLIIASLAFASCTKEEFSTPVKEVKSSPQAPVESSQSTCAEHTLIKPPVDFLFLWDNTSSQVFVSDKTKAALNNTINLISERFDYRMLLAPLVPKSGSPINENSYVISASDNGLSSNAQNRRITANEASNALSTFNATSSADERGLERSVQLIKENISHGVFREGSYLIVVLLSNENDFRTTNNGYYDPVETEKYIETQEAEYIKLRDETLDLLQIRFISLVAHGNCKPGFSAGGNYKAFSSNIYARRYQDDVPFSSRVNDQSGNSTPDSYDICTTDFFHLFDGINNSIQDVVISHKYNFWPVSDVESPLTFNPETIRVFKGNTELFEIATPEEENGWIYRGYLDNQATRYYPSLGEKRSAHMIELFGNARVTHPQCLKVSYDSPTFFYGYHELSAKPIESSIKFVKNGTIYDEQSGAWEYIGFQASINKKIQGPNNPQDPYQEALPAEIVEGKFMIRLLGEGIYKSGDNVKVIFDPSGN